MTDEQDTDKAAQAEGIGSDGGQATGTQRATPKDAAGCLVMIIVAVVIIVVLRGRGQDIDDIVRYQMAAMHLTMAYATDGERGVLDEIRVASPNDRKAFAEATVEAWFRAGGHTRVTVPNVSIVWYEKEGLLRSVKRSMVQELLEAAERE